MWPYPIMVRVVMVKRTELGRVHLAAGGGGGVPRLPHARRPIEPMVGRHVHQVERQLVHVVVHLLLVAVPYLADAGAHGVVVVGGAARVGEGVVVSVEAAGEQGRGARRYLSSVNWLVQLSSRMLEV
jgi:hypothetical protein